MAEQLPAAVYHKPNMMAYVRRLAPSPASLSRGGWYLVVYRTCVTVSGCSPVVPLGAGRRSASLGLSRRFALTSTGNVCCGPLCVVRRQETLPCRLWVRNELVPSYHEGVEYCGSYRRAGGRVRWLLHLVRRGDRHLVTAGGSNNLRWPLAVHSSIVLVKLHVLSPGALLLIFCIHNCFDLVYVVRGATSCLHRPPARLCQATGMSPSPLQLAGCLR